MGLVTHQPATCPFRMVVRVGLHVCLADFLIQKSTSLPPRQGVGQCITNPPLTIQTDRMMGHSWKGRQSENFNRMTAFTQLVTISCKSLAVTDHFQIAST